MERYAINLNQFILFEENIGLSISTVSRTCKNWIILFWTERLIDSLALITPTKAWSNGTTPVGCFNKPSEAYPADLETKIRSQLEGGIAVADDGGVVIIPPERINKDTLERLKRIEMQESIWYYCLDVLKWDTKKIVCDKSYLDNPTELSNTQSEITKFLNKPLD